MAIKEISKDNFTNEVSSASISIVEFFSNDCSVCKMLLPVLEELSLKHTNKKFFKVNTQQNMQLCMTHRVLSLPTTLIFKGGSVVERISGFKNKNEIEQILSKIV